MDTRTPLPRRIVTVLHAFPRRSLAAVLLFVVAAGALGGPVAGRHDSRRRLRPDDADSARAVERIEAATGRRGRPPASCCS